MRTASGVAFVSALVFVLMSPGSDARPVEETNRGRESFNKGWRFERFGPLPDGSTREEPLGLERRDLEDTSWRLLDLPHDWGIEGPFRMDLPGSTGKLPWAGIGWYRKHFTVPSTDSGKRFFVDVDGAMSHTRVWLNGSFLGEWPYGYSSFRLEMTSHVQFDGDNVLAVRLENPPNSSRWYPGAGLYRNVWMVKTTPVHVGHWGIHVTTPVIGKDSAVVRVRAEILNQSATPAHVTVQVTLAKKGEHAVVASGPEATVRLPAEGAARYETDIVLPSPSFWDLKSPCLYEARTTIRRKRRVVEAVATAFGVRTARFVADSGFMLNGQRVRLNGVCNHHDLGPLGTAVNEKALERQVRLIQEMGCNAIRTSHNPPAPELLDICDRMGMLVLDEAFDCWASGKLPNDYSTLFSEWHERDIRALVRRDRNHPCVIAWSSGNEVREQADGTLSAELRAIILSEDSTRQVTAGCDNPQAGFNGFQNSVDVFGYNYKPHLYEKFRAANPSKPLFGSETASCVSSNGEYTFPVSEQKSEGMHQFQMSSYDLYAPPWATIPDVEFEAQDKNPSVAGEFVWTGFDYLGEPTPFTDDKAPSRSSYFGIFDLCGFRKDRFYLYQSRWRPDLPVVHVLPHWNWPDRLGQITPVHVYTSGDEVELFLNGKSLGRKGKQPFQYRLRWDDVVYAPGELRAIAYKDGRAWSVGVMRTTGEPERVELSVDRTVISADGKDLAFVSARVVDSGGLTVPTASNLVRFCIDGPGVIIAVGNGDATSHDSFHSHQCRAFHGQCLAIIRSVEAGIGTIRVTVEADALATGSVTMVSQ